MPVARRIRRRGWMNAAKRASQLETSRPIVRHFPAARARAVTPVEKASVYVFDVEGTLVDTVLPALNCWCQTLEEFGLVYRTADLHRFSGLDAQEVLERLLPQRHAAEEFILSKFVHRFRSEVLPAIRAFPGARELLATLKRGGAKIALATCCDPEELAHYRNSLNADDCIDVFVSGDDIRRGKPHPDLVTTALKRLGVAHPGEAVFVGDTPYDAEAAHRAGVRSFGMLSGHFSRADLLAAGCAAAFLDVKSLDQALAEPAAAA